MFFEQMHPTWQAWLADTRQLLAELELLEGDLQPAKPLVMKAFEQDPLAIRVVLLGQDPYPTPGDAVGLAFAMPSDRPMPRSLVNILKELENDLGIPVSETVDLSKWQHRGVMLLNTTLTTLAGKPASHSKTSWPVFTQRALVELAKHQKIVILAWGNHAIKTAQTISGAIVIQSAHPSPLSASRGFFGSKPFSRANQALKELGLEPIDWAL